MSWEHPVPFRWAAGRSADFIRTNSSPLNSYIMYYLGQVTVAAPVYIYLTDNNVTGGNKQTRDYTKRIKKLFADGKSGTRTTIWKLGQSDRLDIQNDNVAGQNIDPIFNNGTYSNFSYQAGNDSFSVVFIENSITSSIAVQDALKAYFFGETSVVRPGLWQLCTHQLYGWCKRQTTKLSFYSEINGKLSGRQIPSLAAGRREPKLAQSESFWW